MIERLSFRPYRFLFGELEECFSFPKGGLCPLTYAVAVFQQLPPNNCMFYSTAEGDNLRQNGCPSTLTGFFLGERENPFSFPKEKGFSQILS